MDLSFKEIKGRNSLFLYMQKTKPYPTLSLPKHPSTSEYTHLDTWVFTVEAHQLLTRKKQVSPSEPPWPDVQGLKYAA